MYKTAQKKPAQWSVTGICYIIPPPFSFFPSFLFLNFFIFPWVFTGTRAAHSSAKTRNEEQFTPICLCRVVNPYNEK